jgi:hypothetical protein
VTPWAELKEFARVVKGRDETTTVKPVPAATTFDSQCRRRIFSSLLVPKRLAPVHWTLSLGTTAGVLPSKYECIRLGFVHPTDWSSMDAIFFFAAHVALRAFLCTPEAFETLICHLPKDWWWIGQKKARRAPQAQTRGLEQDLAVSRTSPLISPTLPFIG